MYKTPDIRIELNDTWEDIQRKVAKKIRLNLSDVAKISYARRSVDARDKQDIFFICSFYLWLKNEKNVPLLTRVDETSIFAMLPSGFISLPSRPIVVGFGPCGMMMALALAKLGCKPIVFERGKSIEQRTKDVDEFFRHGKLQPDSNIQFGEGGAGTFSDGKLTASYKDQRSRQVLNEFVAHGAPQTILYDYKPHIGTDELIPMVREIRKHIESLGGDIYFEHHVVDLKVVDKMVTGIYVKQGNQSSFYECRDVFLACGHSARDTFTMLHQHEVAITPKPFAIGLRIEHLQSFINESQYGTFANHPALGAADYKLVTQLPNGRAVYSFCMCPGGYVVHAASENNTICTNGMSYYHRSGKNANSALLVSVTPQDYPSDHPLAGMEFQRKIEQYAYRKVDGYRLPVQTVGHFLNKTKTNELSLVVPSCRCPYVMEDLRLLLPSFIIESLQMALPLFDKKIRGFSADLNILVGVETRSSSPIRIERDNHYCSVSLKGLYPCGEGAGFAGGIISAAVDGIKAVESVLKNVYNIGR